MSLLNGATSRAVVCVRVSPRPAENVRYSPEIQEQKCRDWCDQRGIPVVRVIQDILVSGGSASRFDSILRSLTEDNPTHFVVSDISRWTRDHPKRYWVMRSLIEEQGVQLVSVDQPHLSEDTPFSATIATAQVEANYLQRLESNKKTALGVRAAWAKGKRFGKIWGWTFDGLHYTQDTERIRSFYEDVAAGLSYWEIAQKYDCRPSHVPTHVRAVSQRDVVGQDLWQRAQLALLNRRRSQRRGAAQSNVFRGLLICPWCGEKLQHRSNAWGNYLCPRVKDHPWRSISAPLHVVPAVRDVLDRLRVPLEEHEDALKANQPPEPDPAPDPQEIRDEIERLGLLWAGRRLSDRTYQERVEKLEALLEAPSPPPTVEEQADLIRELTAVDLLDRDPRIGEAVNGLLHAAFGSMQLRPDRTAVVRVRPEYAHWLV